MPLFNYMAVLRLNPALDAVESGVVLRCEALNNTVRCTAGRTLLPAALVC